MTTSEVTDLTEHNEHLMMSFAIQAILNIHKVNDFITRLTVVNASSKFVQINCYGRHLTKRSVLFDQWLGEPMAKNITG